MARSDYEAGYDMGVATCKAEIERLQAEAQELRLELIAAYGQQECRERGEEANDE